MVDGAAPFAGAGLDRVFHEKARLAIVTALAGHAEGVSFRDLKALCALTDGNLNRHLQVLEDAGHVLIEKRYRSKRPQTICRLSPQGRLRFDDYLAVLEQVLLQANRASGRAGLAQPAA